MATVLTHPHRTIENLHSGFSPAQMVGGDAVHVAVGKSMEKTIALLQWTFSMFSGHEIVLIHVHRPSTFISTPLGKLPARRANPEMLAAFRHKEGEETMKLLSTYLMTCSRSRVKASIITTESDEVRRGIVDLVNLHNIRKLVVGAAPDFMRRTSSEASHVAKHAPSYCEMWFVNKRKLIWERPASVSSSARSPICRLATPFGDNLTPWSLNPRQNEFLKSTCEPLYRRSVSSSANDEYATQKVSIDLKTVEECLRVQLEELKREVDGSIDDAFMKLHEPNILEDEAVEAFNKVKALETAHYQKEKLRIDAEDALRITIQGQEELLEEREKTTLQLQKTMRNMSLLGSRAQEANRRCEEVAEELKLIETSIATLQKEKQKLQVQKNEAARWLDRWRNHEIYEDAKESGVIGLKEDSCEVPELLSSDVEAATCNFCGSLKIGEGEYGTVYRGEMSGNTVAIKKLHAYNMQSHTEFNEAYMYNIPHVCRITTPEAGAHLSSRITNTPLRHYKHPIDGVQVLGKLRHPHLVNLIGVCPKSWALVYEYLPGGSLQNYLYNKRNISALNWKIRARIVADIASGLLSLQSFKSKKIVHGNLKPENLFLDSENRCKISDCGDNMFAPSQAFRCCSASSGVCLYTDPESYRTGTLTHMSDIYSFGVIVLQLVTGKTKGSIVGKVRRAVSTGKITSVLDLSAGGWSTYVSRRLVELGLHCCKSKSRDRPELTLSLVRELECMPILEEQTVPSFFLCPIFREIMQDPQVAADGFTYDGEALRGWLGSGGETSPMTNLKLSHLDLTPNYSLRLAIQDWVANLKIAS
ncbi:hypothetical protein OROHE_021514 [Orobanche hederae]